MRASGCLRTAADHEDAIDKHPVTPGALLPVREILADLLLENGAPARGLEGIRGRLADRAAPLQCDRRRSESR